MDGLYLPLAEKHLHEARLAEVKGLLREAETGKEGEEYGMSGDEMKGN